MSLASFSPEAALLRRIRPGAEQHGFSQTEVSELMRGIYQRGDQIMMGFLVAHTFLALGLAFYHQTFRLTIIVSALTLGGFGLLVRLWPRTLFTRSMASVAQQVFVALHIYQMQGQPEQHFWFFTAMTMMIVYQDWVCMWPGTLLIIAQHIVFAILHNLGYPVHFFPESHVEFTKLFFHFGIALVHTGMCGYWAVLLRGQTLSDAWQRLQLAKASEQLAVELQHVTDSERAISAQAEELRESARRQDVAAAEALRLQSSMQQAQKLESLGLLAGGVAHDFNNLLMIILANASLTAEEFEGDAAAQETISEIRHAAQRAADLTRQMLAYSGRAKFVVRPTNLTEVVSEMASLLSSVISKKAVIRLQLADKLPLVQADDTQLGQVVMNLITNASDALGDAPGEIVLSTGFVELKEANQRDESVESLRPGLYSYIEVSDTGQGMDPETQSRIFDPFFTTKFTGRGLGLASVQGIVRGHGGEIRVASQQGRGSVFRVLLPADLQISENAVSSEAVETPQPKWSGALTVLLADDEDQVRVVAARMLERLGYRVVTARDGKEAVEIFRQRQCEISLALLDVTMPNMNGAEACLAIRRLAHDVPVILSSGYAAEELPRSVRELSGLAFLPKPYERSELQAAIAAAFSERGIQALPAA